MQTSVITKQLAKHLREIHFGGNWTVTNYKDVLQNISWEQAIVKPDYTNSIIMLVYHTHYFVREVSKVLGGAPLTAHDKYSFDHPNIENEKDWNSFLEEVWNTAEIFSQQIEQLPDDILEKPFTDSKYGTYYRNLMGIIEHLHYHLGQIVIIQKIINREQER